MKKLKTLTILSILLFTSLCLNAQESEKMPVTTSSDEALKCYQAAFTSFEKGRFTEVLENLNKAIELEPDFFMAHFNLAMNNLSDDKKFKEIANKAIAIKAELSDAEKIFKQINERWLTDKKSDVTDLGAKLIDLYPKDPRSYICQSLFYTEQKNFEKAIDLQKSAIELVANNASFYNMLGYSYLAVEKFKEAEIVLNKYIELEPNEANPYDSKGDYYMAIKDYKKAQEHFEKAYKINKNFTNSLKKAEEAKKMMESVSK